MDMQYTERLIATNKTKSKPKPNFSALSPVRASDLLFRTGEHGKCTEAIFWPVWGRLETLFARGIIYSIAYRTPAKLNQASCPDL
jgi:hypothetical protein